MLKPLIIFLSLISVSAFGASTCKKLIDCVSVTTELTGIKFMYPQNLFQAGDVLKTELTLTKENAPMLLSETLNLFGYMKLPSKVENVWKIISARDIRYESDLPAFTATKSKIPTLPETNDPIHFTYQAMPEADVKAMARNLRPVLSRYGRVLDLRGGGIIVIDLAANVKKMIPMLVSQDFPPTKAELKLQEEERKHQREIEILTIKHPGEDNHRHDIEDKRKPAPGMKTEP